MARKDKDTTKDAASTDQVEQAIADKSVQNSEESNAVDTFTGIIAAQIVKARGAGDHAATATLETLHMHAGEFQMRLRAAETQVEGDVLSALKSLKEIL